MTITMPTCQDRGCTRDAVRVLIQNRAGNPAHAVCDRHLPAWAWGHERRPSVNPVELYTVIDLATRQPVPVNPALPRWTREELAAAAWEARRARR